MMSKLFLLVGLALFLAASLLGRVWAASSTTPTISIINPQIDDPAPGVTGTRADDVNNAGNVLLQLDTASQAGFEVGFIPNHGKFKGKFLTPVAEPGAILTLPSQMNDSNTIVGEFEDSSFVFHGFTLNTGVFTTFDVSAPGAFATGLFGINNQGDLGGLFTTLTPTDHDSAFVVVGGVETDFDVTGAAGDQVLAINSADVAVGRYSTTDPFIVEATCGCHGFERTVDGAITTFDPAGSVSTVPRSINRHNVVVGRYYDSLGVVHGFAYFLNSATSITYDYPGATATSLNGINDRGEVAARFTDSSNVVHGFLARLSG